MDKPKPSPRGTITASDIEYIRGIALRWNDDPSVQGIFQQFIGPLRVQCSSLLDAADVISEDRDEFIKIISTQLRLAFSMGYYAASDPEPVLGTH